ncbi:hypothetical protein ES703_72717 [subsurface metagenome]
MALLNSALANRPSILPMISKQVMSSDEASDTSLVSPSKTLRSSSLSLSVSSTNWLFSSTTARGSIKHVEWVLE